MSIRSLFSSAKSRLPAANANNEAGGRAYQLEPKHALAQLAATGTFGHSYYSESEAQLREVLSLIEQIDDNQYLAKLALYSREKAFMKDMPAVLLVALSVRDTELMHKVFDRVVDNGRVLRNVFQMVRSGQFRNKAGKQRLSLSSSLQRAFQRWLNEASPAKLLSASIGNDPSLRDVLRLARPTPKDNQRRALFGWLTEKPESKWAPASASDLPAEVQSLLAYRLAESEELQAEIVAQSDGIRWDLMAEATLGSKVWSALARKMGPQALRMNLNTLQRHGVFGNQPKGLGKLLSNVIGVRSVVEDPQVMIDFVAKQIADPAAIARSRQFPYQYFTAYLNASEELPQKIKTALQKAAEIACGNVPQLPGPVLIGLDTSGSMNCPVTGHRGRGATSKMRCVDVAALVAAAILRKNPDSVVVPFDTKAYDAKMVADDSILSIAARLAKFGGGGTDCSLPLKEANRRLRHRKFAGAIMVSDNESWIGTGRYGSTGVMTAWEDFIANQRKLAGEKVEPKLVCIDVQPYQTTQAVERKDILNIGGFSDSVFNVISGFLADDQQRFVAEVESMVI